MQIQEIPRFKKCFFSELHDFSQEADFYNLSKSHSKSSRKTYSSQRTLYNSTYQLQNSNNLTILSKGGMLFNLPLDQQILNIFPLADGLLIEFCIKQEPKFPGFYISY